jgi:hypothetical protein
MTALDKFGYKYIYDDLLVTNVEIPGKTPLIEYFYSEKDGWSYQSDSSRHVSFIFNNITIEQLTEILLKPENKFHKIVKDYLQDMVNNEKIKSGSYFVPPKYVED